MDKLLFDCFFSLVTSQGFAYFIFLWCFANKTGCRCCLAFFSPMFVFYFKSPSFIFFAFCRLPPFPCFLMLYWCFVIQYANSPALRETGLHLELSCTQTKIGFYFTGLLKFIVATEDKRIQWMSGTEKKKKKLLSWWCFRCINDNIHPPVNWDLIEEKDGKKTLRFVHFMLEQRIRLKDLRNHQEALQCSIKRTALMNLSWNRRGYVGYFDPAMVENQCIMKYKHRRCCYLKPSFSVLQQNITDDQRPWNCVEKNWNFEFAFLSGFSENSSN